MSTSYLSPNKNTHLFNTSHVSPGYSPQRPPATLPQQPTIQQYNNGISRNASTPISYPLYGQSIQGLPSVYGGTQATFGTQPQHTSPVLPGPLPVARGGYVTSNVQPAGLYNHISGLNQPKQTQRRVSYHPYVRTYIDYQQKRVLVPVERTRIAYYQRIIETSYQPKQIEIFQTQTVPVQRQIQVLKYVPVQQKIIHFPKDQKRPNIVHSNINRNNIISKQPVSVHTSQMISKDQISNQLVQRQIIQNKEIYNNNAITTNVPNQNILNKESGIRPNNQLLQQNNKISVQNQNKIINFKQSQVQRTFSSAILQPK